MCLGAKLPGPKSWLSHLHDTMINFMCQYDWAMGYPDIWSNIILGVSMKWHLHKTAIRISRTSKVDCSPYCGGPHSIS